jgi:hypothetical protein
VSFSQIQKSHKETSKHLVAVGKAGTMSRIVVLVSLAVAAEAFVAASPTLAPSRVHTRVRLDGAGSRTSTLSLRATVGQRPSASVNARARTHKHRHILNSEFSRTHTHTLKHTQTHTNKLALTRTPPHPHPLSFLLVNTNLHICPCAWLSRPLSTALCCSGRIACTVQLTPLQNARRCESRRSGLRDR